MILEKGQTFKVGYVNFIVTDIKVTKGCTAYYCQQLSGGHIGNYEVFEDFELIGNKLVTMGPKLNLKDEHIKQQLKTNEKRFEYQVKLDNYKHLKKQLDKLKQEYFEAFNAYRMEKEILRTIPGSK